MGWKYPPCTPPRFSTSSIILFRAPVWTIFYMLPLKMLGRTLHIRHFPKWPPVKPIFTYNSASETHTVIILVYIPMFSRSNNSIRTRVIMWEHLNMVAILNFKMAAIQTNFYIKLGFWNTYGPNSGVYAYVFEVKEFIKNKGNNVGAFYYGSHLEFQNGHHSNQFWHIITWLLKHVRSKFWCLYLCFLGQGSQ